MTERPPLFSVVIPAYNAAATITGTLESVAAQSWREFEILVVDDGSTDRTVELTKKVASKTDVNLRLVDGEHRGASAARNAGIRASRGEWIAFLDADDKWKPEKLEMVAEAIQSNPRIDLVSHAQIETDPSRRGTRVLDPTKKYDPRESFFLQLYRGNFLVTSALVVSRSCLQKAGEFEDSFPSAQDYDLWLRVSARAQPYFIEKALGWYLISTEGITANLPERLSDNLRIALRYRDWLKQFSDDHPRRTLWRRYLKSLFEVVRVAFSRRAFRQAPAILMTFIMSWQFHEKALELPVDLRPQAPSRSRAP